MSRRVYITGVGPVSGLGIGIEPTWEAVQAGRSALAPITAFDPSGFDCRIAAQVPDYKISQYVPKTHRKATKVMARDIELAVIAADQAARDAGLVTLGTAGNAAGDAPAPVSYESRRMGCHIGAGLIAADLNELTAALAEAKNGDLFDMHEWGRQGMAHLTPLWLLKYLPNMLACHVTIIHAAHGPSNTITCGEASSGLSIGESLRVIQRGAADLCFCGGAESKLNPMAYLRQHLAGRLAPSNGTLASASGADGGTCATNVLRPFDQHAAGTVLGEGGGIVILEAADTYEQRQVSNLKSQPSNFKSEIAERKPYAEVLGLGASQSVNREHRNLEPDPTGKGVAAAIRNALREAQVSPHDIDLIVPFGSGVPLWDRAEVAALLNIFGDELATKHVTPLKPLGGNCGAGSGALEMCIAAKALAQQTVPPILNRGHPLPPLGNSPANPQSTSAQLRHALVYSTAYAGQNTALVLRRV